MVNSIASESAYILLVEDDEANRKSYTRALTKVGYKVAAFPEAKSAINHLRKNRDVVLVNDKYRFQGKLRA